LERHGLHGGAFTEDREPLCNSVNLLLMQAASIASNRKQTQTQKQPLRHKLLVVVEKRGVCGNNYD